MFVHFNSENIGLRILIMFAKNEIAVNFLYTWAHNICGYYII